MKRYLLVAFLMITVAAASIGLYVWKIKSTKVISEDVKEVVSNPTISNDVVINGKVLFVLTSRNKLADTDKKTGIWLSELTHPYYEFIKNNIEVDIASIRGGNAPIDPSSLDMNDVENAKFMAENKPLIENTKFIEDVKSEDYNAIYFVGGHGTMWDFPNNLSIKKLSKEIYENNGIIGAVCHGPAALVNVKLSNGSFLIDGKRITAFSNSEEKTLKLENIVPFSLEDKIIDMGSSYNRGNDWAEYVVEDQRIVTGQNPASAKQVAVIISSLIIDK